MANADVQPKTGTTIAPRPHERFVANLQARAQENGGKNRAFEVAASQMDKILSAETEEDIFNADEGGTISGQDFVNEPFEVRSYEISQSDSKYDSDLGVYVNIQAVALTDSKYATAGEQIVINTGATLVITKLEALRARNLLPVKVVIRATPARNGDVLKLRQAPPVTVTA
jgi:hypothetical protein